MSEEIDRMVLTSVRRGQIAYAVVVTLFSGVTLEAIIQGAELSDCVTLSEPITPHELRLFFSDVLGTMQSPTFRFLGNALHMAARAQSGSGNEHPVIPGIILN